MRDGARGSLPVVELRNIGKTYALGDGAVVALDGVDLTLKRGEFAAIMGPSGSGKSTLMDVIGLLDRPTSGTYLFEGQDVALLSADELADLRCTRLGFVFQSYNLLPRTTSLENVELPMLYAGVPETDRRRRALEALETVGVGAMAGHISNQMSGGQQQRVAIARALVNDPSLILADEPTGALDTKSSDDIMRLFASLNAERGITILLVTHEPDVGRKAKRIITVRDGRIVGDGPVANVPISAGAPAS
jgi:putative ABC transport system ATP-binding protein